MELLDEWSRQQQELAQLVSQRDARDWHLGGGPAPCPLKLVGGLDISFVGSAGPLLSPAGLSSGGAEAAPQAAPTPPAAPEPAPEAAVAALVVLSFPSLGLVYEDLVEEELATPYRPGFLGFRECPAYLRLLERARQRGVEPQVLLVDGFGVLHPRRLGSASQLGVMAGVPTIGVAKNLLHVDGLDQREVRATVRAQQAQHAQQAQQAAEGPGAEQSLYSSTLPSAAVPPAAADNEAASQSRGDPTGPAGPVLLRGAGGEVLGAAVCPPGCSNPIYVSVGHMVSLATAVAVTLRCCRHRIPEPIRQADLRSRERVRQLAAQRAQHVER